MDLDAYDFRDDIDLDTASSETLRRAAARVRQAVAQNERAFLQMPRQAPTPSPQPEQPSLASLIGYRRIDDPMPVADERDVARGRALAEIQIALAQHEAEQAQAAEAAKAERAQAFKQTAIGQLFK